MRAALKLARQLGVNRQEQNLLPTNCRLRRRTPACWFCTRCTLLGSAAGRHPHPPVDCSSQSFSVERVIIIQPWRFRYVTRCDSYTVHAGDICKALKNDIRFQVKVKVFFNHCDLVERLHLPVRRLVATCLISFHGQINLIKLKLRFKNGFKGVNFTNYCS